MYPKYNNNVIMKIKFNLKNKSKQEAMIASDEPLS
jgi:hypothetical protein